MAVHRTLCHLAFSLGEWYRETVLRMQDRAKDQREMCRLAAVLDEWPELGGKNFGAVLESACDRHPNGGVEMLCDIRESLIAACETLRCENLAAMVDALRELHDFAVVDTHFRRNRRSHQAFKAAAELLQRVSHEVPLQD